MFAALTLLLLSVITTARFCLCETTVNSTSFNDIVDRFPECGTSCYHDFYSDVLTEYCGDVQSSTDLKDAACICREGRNGEIEDETEDKLTPCLLDRCDGIRIGADVDSYLQPARDLLNWCAPALEKYGTELSKPATLFFSYLCPVGDLWLTCLQLLSAGWGIKSQPRKSVDIRFRSYSIQPSLKLLMDFHGFIGWSSIIS